MCLLCPLQVWAAPLGLDAQGGRLSCEYKTQSKAEFQDAVGAIALRVCQVRQGCDYMRLTCEMPCSNVYHQE
jgi:hypothetical protein